MDVGKAVLFIRWQLQAYTLHAISICLCSSLDKRAFNKFSIYFSLDGEGQVYVFSAVIKI